eukprot:SAG11_NODE_2349_length_3484_cov_2.705465_2_plen_149_part_01
MIRDWMVYVEAQLLVRSAADRQADAKKRLFKEWKGPRKQLMLTGVRAVEAARELKRVERPCCDFTILYGADQQPRMHIVEVGSIADTGLVSLPQLLAELDVLEIAKVRISHDSGDGDAHVDGNALDVDASAWMSGKLDAADMDMNAGWG